MPTTNILRQDERCWRVAGVLLRLRSYLKLRTSAIAVAPIKNLAFKEDYWFMKAVLTNIVAQFRIFVARHGRNQLSQRMRFHFLPFSLAFLGILPSRQIVAAEAIAKSSPCESDLGSL